LFGNPPATEPAAPAAPADDLFGAPPATDPAAPAAPADDLFGAPPATDPAAPAAGGTDDLFGANSNAPAVTETPAVTDDLFGAPAATPATDDLFNTAPATETPATESKVDDLFGTQPAAPESTTASVDDLFSQAAPVNTLRQNAMEPEGYEAELPAPVKHVAVSSAKADPLAETANRTWVDNTGTFKTEGRLILIGDGFIRLLKSNGNTCTVPNDRMSKADANYVNSVRDEVNKARVAMLTAR
jgi:hypothetical protein